jgi:hypothetical protein
VQAAKPKKQSTTHSGEPLVQNIGELLATCAIKLV